jgi:hypothetical protein
MSEPKFLWVNFARWILVFPAAVAGLVIWSALSSLLPPVGGELYLASMAPPDHVYNVYLDSFGQVLTSLLCGAAMAPVHRREVVAVGIFMMGFIAGLLDQAFLQNHMEMPHGVSICSYVMSGIACVLALWIGHRLDVRAKKQA